MKKYMQFSESEAVASGAEIVKHSIKVPNRKFYIPFDVSNKKIVIRVEKNSDTHDQFKKWLEESSIKYQSYL